MSRLLAGGLALLALLVVAGSPGCFTGHRRERPLHWPPSAAGGGDGCPDLAGWYRGEAALDPFRRGRHFLPVLLVELGLVAIPGESQAAWRRPTAVEVRLDERAGDLAFLAHHDGPEAPRAFTFRRGDQYRCQDGAIHFDAPARWANANVCGARTARQLQLWRAADGSLVVRTSSQELCVGLALAFAWEAEWYRFRPAASVVSAPAAGAP